MTNRERGSNGCHGDSHTAIKIKIKFLEGVGMTIEIHLEKDGDEEVLSLKMILILMSTPMKSLF